MTFSGNTALNMGRFAENPALISAFSAGAVI
jgi:hypothetical protein